MLIFLIGFGQGQELSRLCLFIRTIPGRLTVLNWIQDIYIRSRENKFMTDIAIWFIAAITIGCVIIRPFKTSEAIWAAGGAALLVVTGLITIGDGLLGVERGTDVYLFLTGMMLLAETAREEKLFDWLAGHAVNMAKGSSQRLFLLIYIVGVIVTAFLSNDATAVVLTPAVAAAVKASKAEKMLPYLLICAFIANAASFLLPISNPANLVIYGQAMPPLARWLPQYLLPAVLAIVVTYAALLLTQKKWLRHAIEPKIDVPPLTQAGKTALWGIALTAVVLMVASALGLPLGWPTLATGILTTAIVLLRQRKSPAVVIKGISWSVLPLVAGLFVMVQALDKTGLTVAISHYIRHRSAASAATTTWAAGLATGFGCNLINNLPAGLVAGSAVQANHIPEILKSAVLIGIDLGPNLSVTGSLASILWLAALRREGISISGWIFLKTGLLVMTPALLAALAALWL